MPLRILHSIRSVNPAGGGPIEAVKQLAGVNRAHGHQIEVLSLDSPDDPWVSQMPLPCHALGPARGSYGYSPQFARWLRSHASDYDAVIIDGIWQYNALGAWRALRGLDVPYFVFTHGMLDPWFKRTYPLKHLKKWLYWPWGDYRVLRDARTVFFTCEEEKRLARQSFWLYRCRERVVTLGTAGPGDGDPEAQKRAFLAAYPETQDKACLLFLGRVHVKKGADLLLRAFAQSLDERGTGRPLHLVIAGPDDHAYAHEMKALAAELGIAARVTWTGMLSGDRKWGAFRAAEAFVLPSHQENFGIAVVEALACRCPVLISNKVNIWREIADDGAGLVENDDLPGTSALIRRWRDTPPPIWQGMREQAAVTFARRFQIEASAASLISALAVELSRTPVRATR